MDKFAAFFKLAWRQQYAIERLGPIFRSAFSNGFSAKRLMAFIVAFFEMFGSVFADGALTPIGDPLDLTGYSLVFCDEFEGDSLDTDVWYYRVPGPRKPKYNNFYTPSQVNVKDGNLTIDFEYLKDGEYGEGWYTGEIAMVNQYKNGYFEIRCICNKESGPWSAFWLTKDGCYDEEISQGGVYASEVDIMEAFMGHVDGQHNTNAVIHAIHCNGTDDDPAIDNCRLGHFKVENDIYTEYNTYGMKWTEDEYIFYINGYETCRSSFGKGVCQTPLDVIISVCAPTTEPKYSKDISVRMTVDYVKIWQITDTEPDTTP